MSRPLLRRALATAAALVALVVASGCELQTVGAPKGSLTLTAHFDDAQHLVPGHAVKVADVQVGSVTKVALDGYRAKVTLSIVDGRHIPVGTTAVLSQTSLLGENYVQLRFPASFDPDRGPFLTSGAELQQTEVEPGIEHVAQRGIEVLSAIQAGDLATILNTGSQAFTGRGPELHDLIAQLARVGAAFADQSGPLGTVVDSLGALGQQLAAGASTIGPLIDNLAGATQTLAAQRQRLVATVTQLTGLAQALNTNVLQPHLEQLSTLLAQLDPIAATLAADHDTIGQLLANQAVVAEKAPHAIDAFHDVLIYAWLDSLRLPDGTIVPLPQQLLSSGAAVRSLLEPPG